MGLTKQYLRHVPHSLFNVIGSGRGGIVYLRKSVIAVAAVAVVDVWDLRTQEKIQRLNHTSSVKKLEVTCVSANPSGDLVAVGYSDGSIRLFSPDSGDEEVTFTGHRSAITCLAFDADGLRLASGSRDTVTIVWDVVGEQGIARLQGHKGPITSVAFLEERQGVVVTGSKDTTVKFWELSTQHCFKTVTGHMTEVWGLAMVAGNRMITGTGDSELRVWQLKWKDEQEEMDKEGREVKKVKKEEGDEVEEKDEEDDSSQLEVSRLGSVLRKGEGRVSGLAADSSGRVVVCHGTDPNLELFVICTEEEVARRLAKKAKKEKKRTGEEVEVKASLQEMVRRLPVFRAGGKVRGAEVRIEGDEVQVALLTANNMVEQVKGKLGGQQEELVAAGRLENMGHRSDVRCLAFSSDNTALATGSSEAVKVWNRSSRTCVRTMASGYCLAITFCPGDRHLAVATKGGTVELYSLASGERTESVAAHTGEVWALVLTADQRGFLTGGADKTVKFWDFELVAQEGSEVKVLSAIHRRTFQVEEGVTALAVSPDSRLFAVALLDSTVKVFFMDSLKFFHNLYGHKLPVVTLHISADSTLLVTGSADRNMKIWGLDFGDVHKSIFAHDDTVTYVRWLPNTHYIFSTGKDGEVKLWDGDTFARIQTLSGHVGEVWSGAVSPNGKWLVSCGKDRGVRLWERTQEVLVLDDERETEREEAAEQEVGERAAVPGEGRESLASRRTPATEKGAEQLLEALQLYQEVEKEGPGASLPPLMLAHGAESALDYVCGVVTRLKSAELEETLLVLPLDAVTQLVEVLARLLRAGNEIEVVARCLLFLLEIHHGPIASSGNLEPVLAELDRSLRVKVGGLCDLVGTNLAGLRHLQDRLEEQRGVEVFTDATTRVRERNKKKKNKEKNLQRAVMAL